METGRLTDLTVNCKKSVSALELAKEDLYQLGLLSCEISCNAINIDNNLYFEVCLLMTNVKSGIKQETWTGLLPIVDDLDYMYQSLDNSYMELMDTHKVFMDNPSSEIAYAYIKFHMIRTWNKVMTEIKESSQ